MRKGVEFMWDTACTEALSAKEKLLTIAPVLQLFDPDAEHEVYVDASDFAVGAALLQRASTGDLLLVEYFSHYLSVAE